MSFDEHPKDSERWWNKEVPLPPLDNPYRGGILGFCIQAWDIGYCNGYLKGKEGVDKNPPSKFVQYPVYRAYKEGYHRGWHVAGGWLHGRKDT